VDFHRRQAAEGIHNVLTPEATKFVERAPRDHLREAGACGDGGGATQGLKSGSANVVILDL
jgi:hypothetical protein